MKAAGPNLEKWCEQHSSSLKTEMPEDSGMGSCHPLLMWLMQLCWEGHFPATICSSLWAAWWWLPWIPNGKVVEVSVWRIVLCLCGWDRNYVNECVKKGCVSFAHLSKLKQSSPSSNNWFSIGQDAEGGTVYWGNVLKLTSCSLKYIKTCAKDSQNCWSDISWKQGT